MTRKTNSDVWREAGLLGGNQPKRKQQGREPTQLEASCELICQFTIFGRPVPWSAPNIKRGGGSSPRMRAYKRLVAFEATTAYGWMKALYGGPVSLSIVLSFHNKGRIPDSTNCLKLIEDALQNVVYVNDRQVVKTIVMKTFNDDINEYASVTVQTM